MAYPPTSLDFINRPNPVEPQSVPEKHPLNGTPRLEQTSNEDFMRMLLEENTANPTSERPAKRQKPGDATSNLLDLPKLPAVKNGVKRMRIPPILRGLHQPPPNAGLLPSISVDQPVRLANAPGVAEVDGRVAKSVTTSLSSEQGETIKEVASEPAKPSTVATKVKRKKWTDDETACLLKGVAKFGIGNWTRILKCSDYSFNGRTAIDLKDRFRICCPAEYKSGKDTTKAKSDRPTEQTTTSNRKKKRDSQPAKSELKAKAEMQSIGIDEPFERSKRRPRTNYTAAEDEALLAGFNRYGNSWASIKDDSSLGLYGRTPTDLRDRFRTKYPDKYKDAGLAPRPDVFPKKAERQDNGESSRQTEVAGNTVPTNASEDPASKPTSARLPEEENKDLSSTRAPKPKPATSILQHDDVFWGAPLDEEDEHLDRPTLDRQILDWPFEPRTSYNNASNGFESGEPSSSRHLANGINNSNSNSWNAGMPGAMLPSLAAITSGGDDFTMQLELPTLVSVLGSLDEGGRGGQIPSLEELLS